MGAYFFILLMLALLCMGGLFLLLGLLFFFLRRRGRKRGAPKKRHAVFSGVFLTLGILLCSLPVGWWLFLRASNLSVTTDYVDTGVSVEGGYHDGAFTVDGVTYEPIPFSASPVCPRGEAVFSWDSTTALGRFFGYHERGNYYRIENDPCLDLIRDDTPHGFLWCPSQQLAQAVAWYGDLSRYQWYLRDWDKDGFSVCTLLTPQPDRAHINDLLAFQKEETGGTDFTLSYDTEVTEYDLCSISADGVVLVEDISLAIYDSRLCIPVTRNGSPTDSTRTDTARPLPAELDTYFSRLLS